jgi:hypothetical protein
MLSTILAKNDDIIFEINKFVLFCHHNSNNKCTTLNVESLQSIASLKSKEGLTQKQQKLVGMESVSLLQALSVLLLVCNHFCQTVILIHI